MSAARHDPRDRGVEPRRVIVTGADSGIGEASAAALASPGRQVALTSHPAAPR